jgi:hypothetical protein
MKSRVLAEQPFTRKQNHAREEGTDSHAPSLRRARAQGKNLQDYNVPCVIAVKSLKEGAGMLQKHDRGEP